ncbi:MAG: hypothetical protein AAGJ93_07255 [Bacteroidota bacterium]
MSNTSLLGQPFNCDGRLILSTQKQTGTEVFTITFAPFFVILYSQVTSYPGSRFNALGFNPKDNYIYAIPENTNTVVRLRSDGSFETVGTVPFVDQLEVYAGDCTPDGRYFCHDNSLDQLLVFQVVDNFALEERIDLFWNPESINAGTFTTRLDDFAVDPNNPTRAYAYQGVNSFDPDLQPTTTAGYFLEINLDLNDPNVGMITPLEPINANINIKRLGSLFFDGFGGLSGYGSQEVDQNALDKRLVGINPFTGGANLQGLGGPSAPASDGCSCPYNLTINYLVEPLVATCTDDEVVYSLTIMNGSYENITAATLTDTVPEGMIIEAINGVFNGDIDPTTGVGTRFLTINNLVVPARGSIQMSIAARIDDIAVGSNNSQVYLRDLPTLFGDVQVSDDPLTTLKPDPAIFLADAIFLENVELDITPTTDCLMDNDGTVAATSPQFLPGLNYQLRLFNEDWEPFIRDISVDENNSFFLDSMPSGEYRLDQLTPQDVRCSYEWKDTTFIVPAPNEQLLVDVQTNAPICGGN